MIAGDPAYPQGYEPLAAVACDYFVRSPGWGSRDLGRLMWIVLRTVVHDGIRRVSTGETAGPGAV
jgi:hypothetical protein